MYNRCGQDPGSIHIQARDIEYKLPSARCSLARLHLEQPVPASAGADLPPSVETRPVGDLWLALARSEALGLVQLSKG